MDAPFNVRDENIILIELGAYTSHIGCPLALGSGSTSSVNHIFPISAPTMIVPSKVVKTNGVNSVPPNVLLQALLNSNYRPLATLNGESNEDSATESLSSSFVTESVIESGRVKDWNLLEQHLKQVLNQFCKFSPEKLARDCAVLLAVPVTWSPSDWERACQLLFEGLQVPAVYLADQPVLSLYGTGQTSGLVIDIGHESTKLSAVWEGSIIPAATLVLHGLGMKRVHDHLAGLLERAHEMGKLDLSVHLDYVPGMKEFYTSLASLIIERGHLFAEGPVVEEDEEGEEVNTFSLSDSLEQMLSKDETMVTLELPNITSQNQQSSISVTLPRCILGGSTTASQLLFSSSTSSSSSSSSSTSSDNSINLSDLFQVLINRLDRDKRATICDNILVTGYAANISGLVTCISNYLQHYSLAVSADCNESQVNRLRILYPAIPEYLDETPAFKTQKDDEQPGDSKQVLSVLGGSSKEVKASTSKEVVIHSSNVDSGSKDNGGKDKDNSFCNQGWTSWIGATMVAKLVFNDPKNYITRSDYFEMGPRVIHRKAI